jgi:hypothetical protein
MHKTFRNFQLNAMNKKTLFSFSKQLAMNFLPILSLRSASLSSFKLHKVKEKQNKKPKHEIFSLINDIFIIREIYFPAMNKKKRKKRNKKEKMMIKSYKELIRI